MKIAVCSDLHLEFGPIVLENTEGADVLVLSGDICVAKDLMEHNAAFANKSEAIHNFFYTCCNNFPHVVYVVGNHEHYHGDFDQTKGELKRFLEPYNNVLFLEKEHVVIGDTAFFGATFWTDMKKLDPIVIEQSRRGMNDFYIVRKGDREFNPHDSVNEFTDTLAALKDSLTLAKASKMVVVSHHAPSSRSCHSRFGVSPINYAFYSDLDEFILDTGIIKAWIHGHTHDPYDYMIGETRVLCNPRGYVGYEPSAASWQLKYVEV